MSTWRTAGDPYFPRANPNTRDEISALRAEVRERKEENATLRARVAELARDWAVADEHDKVSRKLLTHAEAQVAELTRSLKYTAAALQSLADHRRINEDDQIRINWPYGSESLRTVGEILDDANKALEPATQDG